MRKNTKERKGGRGRRNKDNSWSDGIVNTAGKEPETELFER